MRNLLGLMLIGCPRVGRGDLIGLTLWLMYERAQGKASSWYPFLQLFPEATLSPILWTAAELDEQLMGSSVLGKKLAFSQKIVWPVKTRLCVDCCAPDVLWFLNWHSYYVDTA